MRIVIDGNACPQTAKRTCMAVSEQYYVPVFIVTQKRTSLDDNSRSPEPDTRLIPPGEVTYKMESLVYPDDIVVTHDYNLAAAIYEKVLAVVHPEGFIYNESNMNQLLYYRFMEHNTHTPGKDKQPRIRKRTDDEDELFRALLSDLVAPVNVHLRMRGTSAGQEG